MKYLSGVQSGLVVRFGGLNRVAELVAGLLDAIHTLDEQLLELVFGILMEIVVTKYRIIHLRIGFTELITHVELNLEAVYVVGGRVQLFQFHL